MRLRYTRGNSTCSLIEFSSLLEYYASKKTAGSTGDRCEELTRFQTQSYGQFFGNVGPVESLSKHAAALKCSWILVFKARDVWPMYTAAQLKHFWGTFIYCFSALMVLSPDFLGPQSRKKSVEGGLWDVNCNIVEATDIARTFTSWRQVLKSCWKPRLPVG